MSTANMRRFSNTRQFSSVDDRLLAPFPTPCPDWCAIGNGTSERAFHLDLEASGSRPQERIHVGPTFGAISIEAIESIHTPGVLRLCPRIDRDAAHDLRKLAADALAAAEWIEAHR